MATAVETVKVEALFTELVSMKTILGLASDHVATLSLAKSTLVEHVATLQSLLADLPPSYDTRQLQKLIDDMDGLLTIKQSKSDPPIVVGDLLNRCMFELNEQIGGLEGKVQTKFDEMKAAIAEVKKEKEQEVEKIKQIVEKEIEQKVEQMKQEVEQLKKEVQQTKQEVQQVKQNSLAKICLRQMIQINLNAYKTRLFESTTNWPHDFNLTTVTSALCGQQIGEIQPEKAMADLKRRAKNKRKKQMRKKNCLVASPPESTTTNPSGAGRAQASTTYDTQQLTSGGDGATSCDDTPQIEAAKEKLKDLKAKFEAANIDMLAFASALENQTKWSNLELHEVPGDLLCKWVAQAEAKAAKSGAEVKEIFRKKFEDLIREEMLKENEVKLIVDAYFCFHQRQLAV